MMIVGTKRPKKNIAYDGRRYRLVSAKADALGFGPESGGNAPVLVLFLLVRGHPDKTL